MQHGSELALLKAELAQHGRSFYSVSVPVSIDAVAPDCPISGCADVNRHKGRGADNALNVTVLAYLGNVERDYSVLVSSAARYDELAGFIDGGIAYIDTLSPFEPDNCL